MGAFRGSQLAKAIEHAIEVLAFVSRPQRFSEQYPAVALRDDVDGTFVPPGHVFALGSPKDIAEGHRRRTSPKDTTEGAAVTIVPGSDRPPPSPQPPQPPPVEYSVPQETLTEPKKPEVKYEYRGLDCDREQHGQTAHRRERHTDGLWECCACAGVQT
jgi:hypothetical protein